MRDIIIGAMILIALNFCFHVSGFIMPETSVSSNPNGNHTPIVWVTGIRG